MTVRPVTEQVMWHGLIVPDHEGVDALRDEDGCPDIYGEEESRRPIFRKRAVVLHGKDGRSPASSADIEPPRVTVETPQGSREPLTPPPSGAPSGSSASPGSAAVRAGECPSTPSDVGGAAGSRRGAA